MYALLFLCVSPIIYVFGTMGLIFWNCRLFYTNRVRLACLPIIVMFIAIPIFAGITTATYVLGYGPGPWMIYIGLPLAVCGLGYNFIAKRSFRANCPNISIHEPLNSMAVWFCILGISLSPLGGYSAAPPLCEHSNNERGETIADALNMYKADIGFYPEMLDDLLPQYLQSIPNTICQNYAMKVQPDFHYESCNDTESILSYRKGSTIFRLNLQTSTWESIHRYDDICDLSPDEESA